MSADGTWTYTGSGAHDGLKAGQQVSDSITVASKDGTANGTITVNITGTNDTATVSSITVPVSEGNDGAALNASGKLVIADADAGEAVVVAKQLAGTYGTFNVSADGTWTYIGNGANNQLTAGQKASDSITVTSQDGTASGTITVNITGTNDAASVSSITVPVSESNDASSLHAFGQLVIADADAGEAVVVAQDLVGTYGTFRVNADSNWTYLSSGAHNQLTAGQQVSDSMTVKSADGTGSGVITVNITGTNDTASVSSITVPVSEGNDGAALNASGKLVIADADTGEAVVVAKQLAGTYGTFNVGADGTWTYTGNGAHDGLYAGQKVSDSITVTSKDGTASGTITVDITGTNDVPVLSTIAERTFVQGNLAVDNFRTVSATDVDSSAAEITYHLADTFDGIFAIDAQTGQISLANAGKVAALEGSNAGFDLVVTAQDGLGVSSSKTMHVTIDMAVEGTTASLPGGVGDWTIAPVAGGKPGYVFTNTADTSINVFIPAGVTNISFEGGGSLGLAANGRITDTTTRMDHTIRITEGAAVGDEVVLSTTNASQVTVIGQANAAVTDGVKIAADIDVNNLDAIFSVDASKTITVGGAAINPINIANVGLVNAVIADVEYVQFNNAKVLIVGAGGYASLAAASSAAKAGDVIYVANPVLANGDAGMINNTTDISIYIAKGDEPVNMTMLNAGQEVRIYGNHAFTLNGSVGADTVHDYTVLAAGKTNYIYGMDGADILVSHSTDAASRILSGGSGADKLIGGTAVQLLGGDGNDTLLSFGGAAILSGGAGDDILLNAYGSTTIDPVTGKVVLQTVNMTGGSGTDTFGLIGSDDALQSGVMRTLVTDLGTGDKIDLSFVEVRKAGIDTGIDTAANFTAASANNKATMTAAGTTLTFDSSNVATSSESDAGDTNTLMQAGSLVLSNATLTKVSTAMTAGKDSLTASVPDFSTAFAPLTDTYNHHG